MIRVRHSGWNRPRTRAGLVALSELVMLVALLAGLFCVGSQFMSAITNQAGSAAAPRGCSSRSVYRISLNREGDHLWVFRPNEGIVRLEMATGEATAALPLTGVEIAAVAHSRSTASSLICTVDGELILFHESGEPAIHRTDIGRAMILDAAISDDGNLSACATTNGRVLGLCREGGSTTPFELKFPNRPMLMRIGLSHDGATMFLGRIDGTVEFLDPRTGHLKSQLPRLPHSHGHEHVAFAWSDDERLMAIATSNGRIHTFDTTTGTHLSTIVQNMIQPSVRPTALAVTPSGLAAFSSNTSCVIHLADVLRGEITGKLEGHEGIVRSIEFAPDHQTVYSGSYDGTVRQWNVSLQTALRTLD